MQEEPLRNSSKRSEVSGYHCDVGKINSFGIVKCTTCIWQSRPVILVVVKYLDVDIDRKKAWCSCWHNNTDGKQGLGSLFWFKGSITFLLLTNLFLGGNLSFVCLPIGILPSWEQVWWEQVSPRWLWTKVCTQSWRTPLWQDLPEENSRFTKGGSSHI